MIPIAHRTEEKVVLLPRTIEYYQVELTRMLETERYLEAIKLLHFLLQCGGGDVQTGQEWQALLNWLQTMFPESHFMTEEEKEDWSEADLFREIVHEKEGEDDKYAEKLLSMLRNPSSPEKQILALEQLIYVKHPSISESLEQWVQTQPLHPFIQFKVLQTLKARGAEEVLQIPKPAGAVTIDLQEVPAHFDEFPSQITEIMVRVQEISEINNPTLSYFAGQVWNEFLAYIYGTSVYYQMLKQPEDATDAWAGALHLALLEVMQQPAAPEEIQQMYGITAELSFHWEQAWRTMRHFLKTVMPTI